MTPEQAERAKADATPGDTYDGGRPKMHRHTFQHAIHMDSACGVGMDPDGRWRASRRRVYVFDDDYLTEHERFISERVWAEGYLAGLRHGSGLEWPADEADQDNPYREEQP